MNYIYIGKIVNTHGIKGEVRILSDFLYKNEVFQKNRKVYIGSSKKEETLVSYRVHKKYDMVTFEGIHDINEVLKYKGESVYVNRDDLIIDGYLNEDLIGCTVFTTHDIGQVSSVLQGKAGRILVIQGDYKNMVPFVDEFIIDVDIKNRLIKIKEIEGLIHED